MRIDGVGVRVQGSGFRVQGPGSRVQGSGFRARVEGRLASAQVSTRPRYATSASSHRWSFSYLHHDTLTDVSRPIRHKNMARSFLGLKFQRTLAKSKTCKAVAEYDRPLLQLRVQVSASYVTSASSHRCSFSYLSGVKPYFWGRVSVLAIAGIRRRVVQIKEFEK